MKKLKRKNILPQFSNTQEIISAEEYGRKTARETKILFSTDEKGIMAWVEHVNNNWQGTFIERAERNKNTCKAYLINEGVPLTILENKGIKYQKVTQFLKISKGHLAATVAELLDSIEGMFHEKSKHEERLEQAAKYGEISFRLGLDKQESDNNKEKGSKDRAPVLNNIYRELIAIRANNDNSYEELWYLFMGLLDENKNIDEFKDLTSNRHNYKTWKVSFYHEVSRKLEKKEVDFFAFKRRLNDLEKQDQKKN